MLDTNIYDLIVARPGFAARLERAVGDGRIEILRTSVQEDEIARMPDAAKRAAMQRISGRRIPVSERALGTSGPLPSDDMLIAVTAEDEADVLVTEDKEIQARIEIWRFDRLVRFIDAPADPAPPP